MSTTLTASELAFEHWCQIQGIEYRRVREAKAQGHKRPDYVMRVIPHLCFVEIKELAETPADVAVMHELLSGKPSLRWIDSGVRLRQSHGLSNAQAEGCQTPPAKARDGGENRGNHGDAENHAARASQPFVGARSLA